jgi:hypothetical protein
MYNCITWNILLHQLLHLCCIPIAPFCTFAAPAVASLLHLCCTSCCTSVTPLLHLFCTYAAPLLHQLLHLCCTSVASLLHLCCNSVVLLHTKFAAPLLHQQLHQQLHLCCTTCCTTCGISVASLLHLCCTSCCISVASLLDLCATEVRPAAFDSDSESRLSVRAVITAIDGGDAWSPRRPAHAAVSPSPLPSRFTPVTRAAHASTTHRAPPQPSLPHPPLYYYYYIYPCGRSHVGLAMWAYPS